ncbi:MAG: insulinase family protein [Oscillospiraceae bacterium]|jgi:predicted Zn-dependent peptidase|nr:insulinase family protein [Oscillospiraceae bacterium]
MGVTEHSYPNGLRLLLDPMPDALSCTVNLCAASGLRYESAAKAGISHFVEHMLFKGTHTRTARRIAEEADDRGATLNAYTCKEFTCVYARSLPEQLGDMLVLLEDMIRNSRMDEKDIATEKGVILEEIAMYEDMPEELAFDLFYDVAWAGHMLSKNILGSRKTVGNITENDLRQHMAAFFSPEKTVISICGAFEPTAAEAAIAGGFGSAPRGAAQAAVHEPAAFQSGLRFTHKTVEQNQMILAFPGLTGNDTRRYHAALLSTMLGGATSSRLFQRLREELGVVYSVDFFNVHHRQEGLCGVALGLNEKNQVKALREVLRVLRDFPDSVTLQELQRAQAQATAGLVMSMESCTARAARAANNMLLYDEMHPIAESIQRYRAVTLEEMTAFAKDRLRMEEYVFCVLGKCAKRTEKELRSLLPAYERT